MLDKNQSLRGFALLPLLGAGLVPDLQSLFELAASGELRLLPGRQVSASRRSGGVSGDRKPHGNGEGGSGVL